MSKLKSKQDQLLKTHRERELKREETSFQFSISEGPFASSGRTGSANSTSYTQYSRPARIQFQHETDCGGRGVFPGGACPGSPLPAPVAITTSHDPSHPCKDPTEIHSQPNLGSDSSKTQQLLKLTDLNPPGLTVQAPWSCLIWAGKGRPPQLKETRSSWQIPNQTQSQPQPTARARRATPDLISHFFNNCFPDPRHYLGSNKILAFCLLSTKIIWIKTRRNSEADSHIFFHLPAVIVLSSSCLKKKL